MENRNYIERARNYVAPIALAGSLLFANGCATSNQSRQFMDDETAKYITTGKYSDTNKKNDGKGRNSNNKLLNNAVDEGIIRGIISLF